MPLKQLDLNLLPIAVALYDDLSVSRTARRLGVSQPAISRALRRLREVFDDSLFVRRPNGIVPTPRRMRSCAPRGSTSSSCSDDVVRNKPFDPATSTRPIAIAISDVAELAFFPFVIEHFRRHAPRSHLRAVSLIDAQLAEGLESGDVDLAAGHFPTLSARSFRYRGVSRHGFACLMRTGHPLWRHRVSGVPPPSAADRIPGSTNR